MIDKEIIINGVDVSGCNHYKINGKCRIPHYQQGIKYVNCNCNEWDCYFKQFQKEKFENLNNRQMVESAENLIYENSELIKNLKEKEQECEDLKKEIINKNEKIKELRFSVSDLTNRLCYLNAEKSFKIVDLEQALDEIEGYVNSQLDGFGSDVYAMNRVAITKIIGIINKAKGVDNE